MKENKNSCGYAHFFLCRFTLFEWVEVLLELVDLIPSQTSPMELFLQNMSILDVRVGSK